MKRYAIALLALALFIGCASAQPRYHPDSTPVNGCYQDYARQLSQSTAKEIGSLCTSLLKESNLTLAVVTVPTLGNLTVDAYAGHLADRWATADPSNPDARVLVLLAFHDRKMRIELGHTANQRMSDPEAKQIIEEQFIPHFRKSQFDSGTLQGTKAIVSWFAAH
ncbi:MAG: TPM domain-containing protein [Leptospirales bacterium]|nr:TPM domain-containing protein [Leptospirales bacterium]